RVAYLGPQGTYTHQAALTKFNDSATYVPYDTIAHTLEAVHASQVEAACVPLENSLHGSVIETLDLLREDWVGVGEGNVGVRILGECTIGIEHCLVVRRGVGMGDIRRVLSHEQALGQCHNFLSTYLPRATQIRTSSTASAAQQLLLRDDPTTLQSAAICSRAVVDVHNELEVLKGGVQDGEINFTRFIVLASDSL
ncbi:Prephenate dehydratase, partial [Ceratobasidium sp. AG-I]